MKKWLFEEEFWLACYPFQFSEAAFETAAQQVPLVLDLVGKVEGPILDLCCGPGRFSLPLAARGYSVTGLDLCHALLEKGRERATAQNLVLDWVEGNMLDYRKENHFNLALSMFMSFGYFENLDEELSVLKNVWSSLKPGGVFLVDVLGRDTWGKSYIGHQEIHVPGVDLSMDYEVINEGRQIRNHWQLFQNGEKQEFIFDNMLYSASELEALFLKAGFEDIQLYGHYDGRVYDDRAERMIITGKKPLIT